MKKLIGLAIGVVFVAGMTGSVLAQGQPTPAPAAPPAPKEAKKVEKKAAAYNASGTVKSSGADSLVIAGKAKGGKDAEWTFAVDPKTTKIRKAGKDVSASDLAAGDAVHVRYHEHGGKNVADSVMVRTPKKAAEAPKTETPKKDETKK